MKSTPFAKGPKAAQDKTREAAVGAIDGRLVRRAVFMAAFWLCVEGKPRAATTTEALFNFLDQNGNSGRQVYDGSGNESMILFEPMVFIGTDIGPDTHLSLSGLYDSWTSASAQLFDSATGASTKLFDGTTLASQPSTTTPTTTTTPSASTSSGTTSTTADGTPVVDPTVFEHRQAVNGSLSHKIGSFVLTPRAGYSTQINYESYTGGLTVEKNLAQDNFTLAFSYNLARDKSYFFDLARKKFTGWIPKNTDAYEVSATQILGQRLSVWPGHGGTDRLSSDGAQYGGGGRPEDAGDPAGQPHPAVLHGALCASSGRRGGPACRLSLLLR